MHLLVKNLDLGNFNHATRSKNLSEILIIIPPSSVNLLIPARQRFFFNLLSQAERERTVKGGVSKSCSHSFFR